MSVNREDKSFDEDFQELKSRLEPLFDAEPLKAQSDACLRRFLRAFEDVNEAYNALIKNINWREEFGVHCLSRGDDDIEEQLSLGKAEVLHYPDHTLTRVECCCVLRPIVLVTARNHDARNRDLNVLTKFIIYILEEATRKCDEGVIDNLCITFDLKQLIWLLSRRYPERLGKCLIVNSPFFFTGCWALIRLWLHEVTSNKIVFIKNEEHLAEYIPLHVLPKPLF
ncbi:Phosphatidylinositol transfer protein CSR1 [Acropora cervicornis]|uniref:Phosphatidylinositol transfer protein CSR1 n=1 Tax=Acropora cervicornis TaxID=6130 RepID=A0AAD9UUY0_ACRCE|nr:Phosphatidylinositol transfer protein CSR1 [Acropora cervicornis]